MGSLDVTLNKFVHLALEKGLYRGLVAGEGSERLTKPFNSNEKELIVAFDELRNNWPGEASGQQNSKTNMEPSAGDERPQFMFLTSCISSESIQSMLEKWYPRMSPVGIIGGSCPNATNWAGFRSWLKDFFARFNWQPVFDEFELWWVAIKPINISFIIPAWNCQNTLEEAFRSISETNLQYGDEVIIVDDASTDKTSDVITSLAKENSFVKPVRHRINMGCAGKARNTAVVLSENPVIFCLDSDNILAPNSILPLLNHLFTAGLDCAAFQELRYFREAPDKVTHKWIFPEGTFTLADCLAGSVFPGASGNYMYTIHSYAKAGGYPDSSFFDSWGFGLKQMATGTKLGILPNSFYYHRYGHASHWVVTTRGQNLSLHATTILIPFLNHIHPEDVEYIFSSRGRTVWFSNMAKQPIRVIGQPPGRTGKIVRFEKKEVHAKSILKGRLLAALSKRFSRLARLLVKNT